MEIKIKKMSYNKFNLEMNRAKTMRVLGSGKESYWHGYMRGVRRAFHGFNFGTPAEHEQWMELIKSSDELHRERGRGYIDGLRGEPDEIAIAKAESTPV